MSFLDLAGLVSRRTVPAVLSAGDIVQIADVDLLSREVRKHIGLPVIIVLLHELEAEALGKRLTGKLLQRLPGILPELFCKFRVGFQPAIDFLIKLLKFFLCPAHLDSPFLLSLFTFQKQPGFSAVSDIP